MRILLICCFLFGSSLVSQAQDLVYRPKNPAFGGNAYNYSWLLSSATSQDLTKDPEEDAFDFGFDRDPIESFSDDLNRQILYQLSRNLFSDQFGENGVQDGSYSFGDYQIDIASSLDGISITLVDITTGDVTQITVPYY